MSGGGNDRATRAGSGDPPPNCNRCGRRRGTEQPSDGDAARLFAVAAHAPEPVVLCTTCCRTLEAMSLRAAGLHWRAGSHD